MTYSGDRPGPLEGQMNGPAASELSPDDLERLSTEFRPSWELDDAPFAGAAKFSSADVQALQPGEARHRIRQALVTTTDEGFLTGRPERISSHPPPPTARPARASNRPPGPSFTSPPPTFALAPMRAPALSLDSTLEARGFRRRRPSWISFVFVGILLIAVGVWATSSGTASQAAAPTGAAHETPAAAPAPEPSKEIQAAPPPPAPEPAAATVEAVPLPKPVAEPHPVAPTPTPSPARAAQSSSATAHASGGAKPLTHPKSSAPTIVRDVPF